jgi:hypothetical protein
MKKHEINYHKYNNSISFYFEHCNYLKSTRNSFSQKTKKKLLFSKEKLFDQSEVEIQDVENKELLIFFEKTNNSKTILKRSTSNQAIESVMKRLNERSNEFIEFSKRLNERRRVNEF